MLWSKKKERERERARSNNHRKKMDSYLDELLVFSFSNIFVKRERKTAPQKEVRGRRALHRKLHTGIL